MRKTDHPAVVVFYFPLVALPLALLVSVPELMVPTTLEWIVLLGVGVSTQMAQVAITRGLHLEQAGKATSMSYVQIVFAAATGAIFFGEVPTSTTAIGAACVLAGMMLSARS